MTLCSASSGTVLHCNVLPDPAVSLTVADFQITVFFFYGIVTLRSVQGSVEFREENKEGQSKKEQELG